MFIKFEETLSPKKLDLMSNYKSARILSNNVSTSVTPVSVGGAGLVVVSFSFDFSTSFSFPSSSSCNSSCEVGFVPWVCVGVCGFGGGGGGIEFVGLRGGGTGFEDNGMSCACGGDWLEAVVAGGGGGGGFEILPELRFCSGGWVEVLGEFGGAALVDAACWTCRDCAAVLGGGGGIFIII